MSTSFHNVCMKNLFADGESGCRAVLNLFLDFAMNLHCVPQEAPVVSWNKKLLKPSDYPSIVDHYGGD